MYRFSLETVLTHRKHIEDTLLKAFLDAKKDLHIEKKKLAFFDRVAREILQELKEREKMGTSISQIALYHGYIQEIGVKRELQAQRIAEATNRLREKYDALVEAMKNRKILNKLKEKELKIYIKEMQKEEQNLTDEIAVNRFNSNRRSP